MKHNKKTILFLRVTIIATVLFIVWKIVTTPIYSLEMLTSLELQNQLTEKQCGLIYIGRPTCPDCQKFEPLLKQTLKNYDIKIQYYNTEKERKNDEQQLDDLLSLLGVDSIPTVVYIKDGKVSEKIVGNISKEQLISFLERYKADLINFT